jgi:hypothetical protein
MKKFMKNKKTIIISAVAAIVVVGGAVGGYALWNNNKTASGNKAASNIRNGFNGAAGNSATRGNFNPLSGTILSITGSTIVLNTDNNSGQRIINTTSDTQIRTLAAETKDNIIKKDSNISAEGTDESGIFKATVVTLDTFSNQQKGNTNGNNNNNQRTAPNGSGTPPSGTPPSDIGAGENNGAPANDSGNRIMGTITKIDGNKVTVKTRNNETKTIDITNAQYKKYTDLKIADLKKDDKINVMGSDQSAGYQARVITKNS